ncbi:MAG TPA: DUF1080 domain-containing protein [Chitinophagaceae bacterium]|nr:DUF1080 domain-containing protein [Chitinophagaceae bacterium]
MLKILASGFIVAALLGCNNQENSGKAIETDTITTKTESTLNSLTETQVAEGWKLLFDGKSLDGWHQYGGLAAGSAWKVSDGMLYLDTTQKEGGKIIGGGDIVTNEDFENFHLKLEWKISKNGNSGIIFYVHEDSVKYKRSYETGPEMQVLDNEGHPDGKIKKHRAGDLYDLISCSSETVKPAGEWNLAEIKSVNGKLDFFLNGVNVVSTTLWDGDWNKLVANSKFKQWPDFGTFKKGKICLQDHDNAVWFRNIMINKL